MPPPAAFMDAVDYVQLLNKNKIKILTGKREQKVNSLECTKKCHKSRKTTYNTSLKSLEDSDDMDTQLPLGQGCSGKGNSGRDFSYLETPLGVPHLLPVTPSPPTTQMSLQASQQRNNYNHTDKGPFIVHVQRLESLPNSGIVLHPVTFGNFLMQNNIINILNGSIESVGRNRISMPFQSAEDINSFLSLQALNGIYKAFIPSYSISKMGIVRGIPSDLDNKELIDLISVPEGYGPVIKYSSICEEDILGLQDSYEKLLALIRPNAVGIVDAFDIRDEILHSTLGSYDGRVYERLMEEALKSPLNAEPVNQSFHKYLKPFMQGKL